mgnify:CR=1 FL=1
MDRQGLQALLNNMPDDEPMISLCDKCGKEFADSEGIAVYDTNRNVLFLCPDCYARWNVKDIHQKTGTQNPQPASSLAGKLDDNGNSHETQGNSIKVDVVGYSKKIDTRK